jgi:undecaprenol kinase/diacylglycerol kinase (ATP)
MKLLKSFGYAWSGLKVAVKEEPNLRIHLAIAVVVVAMGFHFHINPMEWLILLILVGLVISLELINSAIESLTDLVTKEKLPLAGKVKDISAAAVLVGIIIFGKYIFDYPYA